MDTGCTVSRGGKEIYHDWRMMLTITQTIKNDSKSESSPVTMLVTTMKRVDTSGNASALFRIDLPPSSPLSLFPADTAGPPHRPDSIEEEEERREIVT